VRGSRQLGFAGRIDVGGGARRRVGGASPGHDVGLIAREDLDPDTPELDPLAVRCDVTRFLVELGDLFARTCPRDLGQISLRPREPVRWLRGPKGR
jgi:hypothetical protein